MAVREAAKETRISYGPNKEIYTNVFTLEEWQQNLSEPDYLSIKTDKQFLAKIGGNPDLLKGVITRNLSLVYDLERKA